MYMCKYLTISSLFMGIFAFSSYIICFEYCCNKPGKQKPLLHGDVISFGVILNRVIPGSYDLFLWTLIILSTIATFIKIYFNCMNFVYGHLFSKLHCHHLQLPLLLIIVILNVKWYLFMKQSEINLIIELYKFIFYYGFGLHFHVGFCLDSYIGSPFTLSTTENDVFLQIWQSYVLFAVVYFGGVFVKVSPTFYDPIWGFLLIPVSHCFNQCG